MIKLKKLLINVLPPILVIATFILIILAVLSAMNDSMVVTDCLNCNPNLLETFNNPYLKILFVVGVVTSILLIVAIIFNVRKSELLCNKQLNTTKEKELNTSHNSTFM